MSQPCDFGLIGLAVMGENLALNVESRGYRVAVFNRTTEKVDALMAGRAKGKNFVGCHSIEELMKNLKRPRVVMTLVKAGPAVDDLIEQLLPHCEPGDIIIDGGNTHFADTERRTKYIEDKGLLFVGSGVSGGEEGALKGPSMMPGGSKAAWPAIKPIFQAIAAKVGPKEDIPCCEWVGPRGSGHYVKMVHNGIEYGDMQLICEAYYLLKEVGGLSNDELYDVFADWNRGELQSYLIEITRDIFSAKDDQGGEGYLVDKIVDVAGAKGTGKWMSQLALDLGVPSTLVTTAVYARSLSSVKEAFDKEPDLENLMLVPYFQQALEKAQQGWRAVIIAATQLGIPAPAFTTALAYYDSYRLARLPANLLQAQRDYFGAHTYQRTDKPGTFHSEWLDLRKQPS